jgi:opacity protein-like surface antigen
MKRFIILSGLAVFAALIATPTQAQNRKPPTTQQQEPTWTGLYISAEAGWSFAQSDLGISSTPFSVQGLGSDGAIGCVAAGFDQQISKVVLGVFGNYCVQDTEFVVEPGLFNAKLGNSWSLGGRAGYVFGSALPYVFAAYTQTEHTIKIMGTDVANPDLTGLTLGGGVDWRLFDNWSAGLQYGLTNYQTEDYGTGGALKVDTDQHVVKFRIRYQLPSFM